MIAEGSVLNGRYRLERQIGKGGFARVYLSTGLLLERRVAIKVLIPELIEREGDTGFLGWFVRVQQPAPPPPEIAPTAPLLSRQ